MKQHLRILYLMFGWRVHSLFLVFAVVSNGELQQEEDQQQENDDRLNPAYLNPDLYREGIASLVNAKERAEELLYKNDIIAQLVTEMPYHEIQNRLLISGNHKEENRSFFERLSGKKKHSNCGKGFDIYKLLNVVQKSRERAENLTLFCSLSTTPCTTSSNCDCSSPTTQCTTTERKETETTTKCPMNNKGGAIPMVGIPGVNSYQEVAPSEAYSPISQMNFPFEQMQMQIKPTTILYHERFQQSLVKIPVHKSPPWPEMVVPISSAVLSQGNDDLLQQPKEYKPPMLIPILENPYFPHPLKHLPKAIDTEPNRIGIGESNDNSVLESGYRNFKNFFLSQNSRT